MRQGLVSVIIPNYNYANFLRETLDSVLKQTYSPIEVVVVDDGSVDESREVLESYGERIKSIFQKNQGVSAARNNGVASSEGEFLCFLDADDNWLETKIERQIEAFRKDPKLGLVHVGVDEVDSKGNSLLRRLEGSEGDATSDLLALGRKGVLGGGSGLMVPRHVFDEVGGFDTRLSTSADWDFFYQVSSRYPVGFVPEVLLRYRKHSSNMHSNVGAMEHDMLIAFEKAFSSSRDSRSHHAYSVLNRTLAASYFRAGQYFAFLRTGIKAVVSDPKILFSEAGGRS